MVMRCNQAGKRSVFERAGRPEIKSGVSVLFYSCETTSQAERRPNTPLLGAKLAKKLNGSFNEAKSCSVVLP